MTSIKHLIRSMRIQQWYKNLVIFIPILFAQKLFDLNAWYGLVLGFISLGFISSANYIINDLFDKEYDRKHSDNKLRPIASGKVSFLEALSLAFILFIFANIIGFYLAIDFGYVVLGLFFLTLAYSAFLKRDLLAGILVISINFVLRAIGGTFIIDVTFTAWIVCIFFLALLLVLGKRKADFEYLSYKDRYSEKFIDVLIWISASSLIISYALYGFLGQYNYLILSLPFALYVIFRYLYLVYSNPIIVRDAGRLFGDRKISIGLLLWILSIIFVLHILQT